MKIECLDLATLIDSSQAVTRSVTQSLFPTTPWSKNQHHLSLDYMSTEYPA